VRGEKAGTASDIFALGCVLYEMVTGRRAFSGKSATDTLAAILKEEPPAVADSGRPCTPELDRVIERCLAKNPAQRFHSADDLAFELRSLSSSAGGPGPLPACRYGPPVGRLGDCGAGADSGRLGDVFLAQPQRPH
jgi:eukaryotic-like serine/threonine-protein kinase